VEAAAEFEATRRRDFQRMLGWSFACHVLAVVLAMASSPSRMGSPPSVIAVELVAAPPSAAPAPPRPAPPQPAPPAAKPVPPPPPKPKQVVLPKNPTQTPKPKPARPEPRREVVIQPKVKEEKSLEDLLSDMRQQHGETAPAPAPTPVQTAAVPGPVPSAGTGTMSAEEADWRRRAKLHVRRAWVVPPGFRTEPLETHVSLELDAGGNVVGKPRIVRRSGNPWYDEGVIRGIEKAGPLPPPPEAGKWLFVFVPEDAY
jgi:outer membrane biosynthesis protein TonB